MFEEEVKKISEQYKVIKTFNCDDYIDSPLNLYIDLKACRKDAFDPDEKIVFILKSDFYTDNVRYPSGQMLTLIQKFCNDIDISNPFITIITSNQNIVEEYDWVFENENFDANKFNIVVVSDKFIKHPYNKKLIFHRQENYNQLTQNVEILTSKVRDILENNKSFCTLAWHGINIEPNGKLRPCCQFNDVLGNASKESIKDIWNSESIKNIRKTMMAGEQVKACNACYIKEKYGRDSLRKSSNRKFAHVISDIFDKTDVNGKFDNFHLKYIDARYNNLCNLACRTCGPSASSSWYKASTFLNKNFSEIQPSAFLVAGQNENDIYVQILEHIDTIETIYFAGGEPLIIKKFYDILERLIDAKRTDVELIYNTNLTQTKLKSQKIFDLWNQFSNVSVGGSLDAEGKRAEYIRTNTKWDIIEKNRREMIEKCPHVDFHVSSTTGILNGLHVPDFHRSWVKKGLINAGDFNIQILFSPSQYSLAQAPNKLKKMIKEKYEDHLEWLRPLDKNGRATFGYESIIKHMESDIPFDKEKFWYETNLLDTFYKQNILDYIPELEILPR